ncbi:AAA family ATPase [Microbacter sp. GSS18]|nr:AAA family ATPase [Microbacter sp. GSS18]
MTPDHPDNRPDDEIENGVLADTAGVDTTSIGFLGGGAGLSVSIPGEADHDLDDDDDVIGDEMPYADDGSTPAVDEPAVEASIEPDDDGADDAASVWTPGEDAPAPDAYDESVPAPDAYDEAAMGEHQPEPAVAEAPADADGLDGTFADAGEPDDASLGVADEPEPSASAPEQSEPEPAGEEPLDVHVLAQRWLQGGSTWAEAEIVETTGEVPVAADAPAPYADEDITDAVEVVDTGEHDAMPEVAEPADSADTIAHAAPIEAEETEVTEEPTPTAPEPDETAAPRATTRREAHTGAIAPQPARSVERVVTPRPEVALTSKRLGEFEADRETADLLTADRLLDPAHAARPEPEGAWQHFVYRLSGHRINLGDSKRARARKELDRRIAGPLTGGARFVPVLSRKGGVGKTTVTTLLGMALADARDDRVIAIDANPDRGTLSERITRASGKTVRDLAKVRGEVVGYNDLSSIVARDETRLDVIASDSDPRVAEAFSDDDYDGVASLAAHYYSLVLTDTGTGIVHSVMEATLARADQLVIVAGLSVDEARLASETLTWLETNGYGELARRSVVVLNNSRPGQTLVRLDELEGHFRSRVRAVVRMPYDAHIAAGSAITFRDLSPATREAAREMAAVVVEGLRLMATAA